MRRTRYSPGQVVDKLCEAEVDLASGKSVEDVCRKLGVTAPTYFRWKREWFLR